MKIRNVIHCPILHNLVKLDNVQHLSYNSFYMRKALLFLPLFALIFSLFPTKALAGGGPVGLSAFPLRPFDETKTFILRAEIYTQESCNAIKPSFAFDDNFDGDSITPFTPPNDGTYITRHYNTGQPNFIWKEICDFYVQAKSGVAKQRMANVTALVNGKSQHVAVMVAYGDDAFSKQLQSFGRVNDYDNTPWIDVISEKYIGNDKREVNLQWQKISWATKYFLLAYVVKDDGTISTPFELTTTEDTKATVTLSASIGYRLIIRPCKADDPCDSAGSYDGFNLDKMYNINQNRPAMPTTPVHKITTAPTTVEENQNPIISTTAENKKIEELNQKVASLEGKLVESQKKQNALEKTLNNLISWIRSHFPFFR